jgi:hypothetical protein
VHKIFRMYYEGKEDLWAKSKWAIDYKKFMWVGVQGMAIFCTFLIDIYNKVKKKLLLWN